MGEITITAADAGRRLDKFLLAYLNNASRSFIYKLLRKKRIKLNGKRAEGGELLRDGDIIEFFLSRETLENCRKTQDIGSQKNGPTQKAADLAVSQPLPHGETLRPTTGGTVPHGSQPIGSAPAFTMPEIIFEDEHLLIINKPAGMPSHGGMKGKDAHLLARVLYYLRETGAYPVGATFTPALCNRLDVNTSGLVICGKNYQAIRAVNELFANVENVSKYEQTQFNPTMTITCVEKEYLAVVDGELHGEATLYGQYHKDTATNTARVTMDVAGSTAHAAADTHASDTTVSSPTPQVITAYKSLAVAKGRSLLSVSPITGRSHQIRAHLAAIGHPLSGDKKYGGKPTPYATAQLLHCMRITLAQPILSYPTGITWTAPASESFKKCMAELFNMM